MTPRYFSFADRAEAEAVLGAFVDLSPPLVMGETAKAPAADIPAVGRLAGITYEFSGPMRIPAVRDDLGGVLVPERLESGFHVNMVVPDDVVLPPELLPYEVTPASPVRVFS